jgi:fructuronate reductase
MTPPRLCPETLAHAVARRPAYRREAVRPGILHLGLGNFARAHLAAHVEAGLPEGLDWGIVGASLRHADMAEALTPQGGLYTLAVRDAAGTQAQVIGAVQAVLPPDRERSLIAWMAEPAIRIVSLTVTEKGYGLDAATGTLDASRPDIAADLAGQAAVPRSVPGLLIAGLAARRAAGHGPFTILSCDNLPANGTTLHRLLVEMAGARDRALRDWVAQAVVCPSSMVDRIVPATTEADRAEVAALTGVRDAWPVMTEPFSQWVLEDRFAQGRPPLPGVELVDDVAPYEAMKLRLLNGAHSTIAWAGLRQGHATVADAMGDAEIVALVRALHDDLAPSVPLPAAVLTDYCARLMRRFANPALRHRLAQIATDSSQKIPQRLIEPWRALRAAGRRRDAVTGSIALWLAHVADAPDQAALADPLAPALAAIARRLPDRRAFAAAMLDLRPVFSDLGADPAFRAAVTDAFLALRPARAI